MNRQYASTAFHCGLRLNGLRCCEHIGQKGVVLRSVSGLNPGQGLSLFTDGFFGIRFDCYVGPRVFRVPFPKGM